MLRWTGGWAKKGNVAGVAALIALGAVAAWQFTHGPKPLPDAVDHFAVEDETPSRPKGVHRARREFNALLARDEQSRKETDQWILNTPAVEENRFQIYNNMLSLRVEHRLKMVSREYQQFIATYPRVQSARKAYEAFTAGMNEKLEAIKDWERNRQMNPHDGTGWSGLAHYFSHNGPVDGVFKCYENAVAVDPDNSVNHENLATAIFLFRTDAQAYYKLADDQAVFDRAMEVYAQALHESPDNFELATDIAESYYVIRPTRAEDAIGAWQTVLKLAGSEEQREEVFLHLARFEIHAGRFDLARQYLDRVNEDGLTGHKEVILRNLVERENQAKHPVSTALPATKS